MFLTPPGPVWSSPKPYEPMTHSLALNSNVLASTHGYTSVILNCTKRERELRFSPLGSPSVAFHRHPTPSHIGWHRNEPWPEEGTSDDVTRADRGYRDETLTASRLRFRRSCFSVWCDLIRCNVALSRCINEKIIESEAVRCERES